MKSKIAKKLFFFVDESGDPYFYDRFGNFIVGKPGCSRILILGFIKTEQPDVLRQKLKEIREVISKDEYLQNIPPVKKSFMSFHATDDCPEVREKVYKAIRVMPFKAEFAVARKKENVFTSRHQRKPNLFYDDLITKLFQNQLHKSEENIIYFGVRGNRARQVPLEDAIHKAIFTFEEKWSVKINSSVKVFPQKPEGEPCLQIVDYMTWAIQRAFTAREIRYFDFVKDKVSLVLDVYDFGRYPKNFYNKNNPLELNKISPL